MADTQVQSDRTMPYPAAIQEGRVESSNLPSTKNHNRELLRTKAHWIVDLFPDVLVVQEKTISVIRNHLLVSFVETMPVRDIGRVVYVNVPFFAGLRIIGKNTAHELYIHGLNKMQAMKAKEIIEGLMLDDKGIVDIPEWLDVETRRHHLLQAGHDHDLGTSGSTTAT
jgi:hypothetical protein